MGFLHILLIIRSDYTRGSKKDPAKMSQAVFSLFLLQAVLCALCWAQNPPPSMADTFQASGEVEFHGAESTVFGKCKQL